MSSDGDGLMRRTGTEGALSNSKIESARRFLYDEDEAMGNPANMPLPTISSSSSTSGGGSAFPPPPRLGGPTNLSNNNNNNNNNRRSTNTFAGACIATMSTCIGYGGKRLLYATVVVGIMLGCIFGIASLVGGGGGHDDDGGGGNKEHSNQKRFNEFHTAIIELEISSRSDLETIGSPQYNAIQWLANVDGAKMKANDVHAMELYALACLFYSTSGTEEHINPEGNWINQKNWMTSNGLCSWHGVQCEGDILDDGSSEQSNNNDNGFVAALQLPSNGLNGGLPSELSALTLLSKLDLSVNGLTGTLPKKLSELHELRDLILRENDFSGVIPTDYGIRLSNMRQLNLGVNRLNGPIPRQIEHMVELRSLGLERNQLQGNIPDLEDMSKLNMLYLESNNLDGPFPDSVAKLTSLVELNLSNNHLTGFLPAELAKLTRLGK